MSNSSKNERLYYYLKYQLNLHRVTLAQLAAELDVSIGHIQRAMSGERESPVLRARLKEIFGRDVLAPDFNDYPKDIAVAGTDAVKNGGNDDI